MISNTSMNEFSCQSRRSLADLVKLVQRFDGASEYTSIAFQKLFPLLKNATNPVRETTLVTVGLLGKCVNLLIKSELRLLHCQDVAWFSSARECMHTGFPDGPIQSGIEGDSNTTSRALLDTIWKSKIH